MRLVRIDPYDESTKDLASWYINIDYITSTAQIGDAYYVNILGQDGTRIINKEAFDIILSYGKAGV